MRNKEKHLEFIQAVINRMSVNSFLLKGWNVTLIAALFALATKETKIDFVVIAFIPVTIFWILDAFFLSIERSYRDLYNKVRLIEGDYSDFSMNIDEIRIGKNSWGKAIFSHTLLIFYLSMIGIMLIVLYVIK